MSIQKENEVIIERDEERMCGHTKGEMDEMKTNKKKRWSEWGNEERNAM